MEIQGQVVITLLLGFLAHWGLPGLFLWMNGSCGHRRLHMLSLPPAGTGVSTPGLTAVLGACSCRPVCLCRRCAVAPGVRSAACDGLRPFVSACCPLSQGSAAVRSVWSLDCNLLAPAVSASKSHLCFSLNSTS